MHVRAQNSVISSTESRWRPAACGVTPGPALRPISSLLFISALHEGTECSLSKFASATKVGGVAGTPRAVLPFSKT